MHKPASALGWSATWGVSRFRCDSEADGHSPDAREHAVCKPADSGLCLRACVLGWEHFLPTPL